MHALPWGLAGLIALSSLGCAATPRPPASDGRKPVVTKAPPRDERPRKPAPPLVAPPPGYGHRLVIPSTTEPKPHSPLEAQPRESSPGKSTAGFGRDVSRPGAPP